MGWFTRACLVWQESRLSKAAIRLVCYWAISQCLLAASADCGYLLSFYADILLNVFILLFFLMDCVKLETHKSEVINKNIKIINSWTGNRVWLFLRFIFVKNKEGYNEY